MFISGIAASNQKAASAPVSGWDLSTASYDSKLLDISSESVESRGLRMKPDGTKLFVIGASADEVFQYGLSTAWDISTATYDSVSFDVNSESPDPEDLFFKPDGTKLYVVCRTNDSVYQYTLSTPWDLTTASYDSASVDVSSGEANPEGLFFKPDGTKLYIIGRGGDAIRQYGLSSAWDISTASSDSISYSVNSQQTSPQGVFFKPDGTKFYITGRFPEEVHQYSMSTPWDLTTASYDTVSFDFSTYGSPYAGLDFKPDGTKLYLIGPDSDEVRQFSVS